MTVHTSLGATALGGALATIALSVSDQLYGLKFSTEVQGAIQTVFMFGVVGISKLVEALFLKANIKLEESEK